MQIEAQAVRYVGLCDGVLAGEEHIVLIIEHDVERLPFAVALDLQDAQSLSNALADILPDALALQRQLCERN